MHRRMCARARAHKFKHSCARKHNLFSANGLYILCNDNHNKIACYILLCFINTIEYFYLSVTANYLLTLDLYLPQCILSIY